LASPKRDEEDRPTGAWREETVTSFIAHGQRRAARDVHNWISAGDSIALARLGVLDAGSVARALAVKDTVRRLRASPRLPFLAAHGDSASIRKFQQMMRHRTAADSTRRVWNAAFTEACLALARRDTNEALRRLAQVPSVDAGLDIDVLHLRGRLLAASNPQQAARLLAVLSTGNEEEATLAGLERQLVLARAAERAGDRATALTYYSKLATGWANADPEFRPLVDEVRAAVARLRR
jgi:hypothetical protein